MRRILLLGPGGAGKTTLAVSLGERLGLPVIHLDRHYWHGRWEQTPQDVWIDRLADLLAGDAWIADGNFTSTIGRRIERADTVVFLDLPRRTYLRRVLGRWVRFHGRARPLMPEGCVERFDLEYLRWLWRYPRKTRPRVLEHIDRHRARLTVHHLRRPRDVDALLASLA